MEEFKEGELVIYVPLCVDREPYKYEIGMFKRYSEDKTRCFVYFHSGSTASSCITKSIHKLDGREYIVETLFNSLDKKEGELNER